MTKFNVADSLSFGDQQACVSNDSQTLSTVHACKDPCYREVMNFSSRALPKGHPNYLSFTNGNHLYLNMIDPERPLFYLETFNVFMHFVDTQLAAGNNVLVHCNEGLSRAPSLVLLYGAKRLGLWPADSYASAATEFSKQFTYRPSRGIREYLAVNWGLL